MMRRGIWLLCLLLPARGHAFELQAGRMAVEVREDGRALARIEGDESFVRETRLRLVDARDGSSFQRAPVSVDFADGAWRLRYPPAAGGWRVDLHLSAAERCLVWHITCSNDGTRQQWVEVGVELELATAAGLSFFDGRNEYAAPGEAMRTDDLRQNMPLCAAWTRQTSVGVGLAPTELPSYLRHEYLPGDHPRLATVTRLVIDPGRVESSSFITSAAPGEWGKFEIFEAYYESFPQFFRPHPEIDARATLGSSQYRAYPVTEWSPEICRRLWAGWEWCYAPFRRTGDIVGCKELWDYEPVRPFQRFRKLPLNEFHRWRKQAFAEGDQRCNIAMMFYIPAQVWCEERLARERYADALTTDPKVRTLFTTPWVTGNDDDVRVFPYSTSFAAQSRKDMAAVADELDIAGFAFDTADGTARYRGPALPRLRHRAFDQDGVYCAENVAVAQLMDYVHTLKRRGRTLAVVGNIGVGCYTACLHADTAMLEGEPWKNHRTFADPLRWKMGQKTCVWWEAYGLEHFTDPERCTADQLRALYRGLADFTLLQSLRLGLIPPPNFTQGIERLVHWLPAITECVQTGWQPVPAVRVPEPLWCTRYGKGTSALLAIAHETGEQVKADATVENERLGENAYLFAPYWGGTLDNRLIDGKTVLALHVPVRTPVLLRAVAAVRPKMALHQAQVTLQTTPTTAGVVIDLPERQAPLDLGVRIPVQMQPVMVRCNNGEAVATIRQADLLWLRIAAGPRNRVEVRFRSTWLAGSEKALQDFPFVIDRKPNCVIVQPAGAGPDAQTAAFRIQEYFRYWYGRAHKPVSTVMLPIVSAAPPVQQPAVLLRVKASSRPRVTLEGNRLDLKASDEAQLKQLVFRVLRVLDGKHFYPDELPATVLNRKLGLAGVPIRHAE